MSRLRLTTTLARTETRLARRVGQHHIRRRHPAGDAAIGMELDDGDRLCEDIDENPPPGWDTTKQHDYRTFISVSVIAGDTAYGMLTLDALERAN